MSITDYSWLPTCGRRAAKLWQKSTSVYLRFREKLDPDLFLVHYYKVAQFLEQLNIHVDVFMQFVWLCLINPVDVQMTSGSCSCTCLVCRGDWSNLKLSILRCLFFFFYNLGICLHNFFIMFTVQPWLSTRSRQSSKIEQIFPFKLLTNFDGWYIVFFCSTSPVSKYNF